MGVGSVVEDRVYSEAKRLCYAGLDAATLRREAVGVLRRVVPFEAYCCFTTDPLSWLPTDVMAEGQSEGEGRFFLENIYFEDDVNRIEDMVRSRRMVALLSESTGGKLERALRQREFRHSKGLEHELRSAFTVGRTLWGGVEFSRERGRPDFNAREVAFVGRLAPHLGAGLKAAALRAQALPEAEDNGLPGVLTLDHKGRVVGCTRAAERWLRELGDPSPGWEGDGLPAAVYAVAGMLRRALRSETEADAASIPRVCVRTPSGRWLALQADLSEPSSGRPSETVIVIQPAGPKEVAWLHTAVYGLSPREREITDLIVRGFSTKQISASLYISEYTVQDHLSNIFEKVGVRGRRNLVKRLYLNAIYQ